MYGCGSVWRHGVRRRGLDQGVDVDGFRMFGCLGTMREEMWVCHGFCLCEMRGGLKIGVGLKWVIYPVGYNGWGKTNG